MMNILLDTHVWIWYALGSPELKNEMRKRIEEATNENKVYLAAISLWEISMLEQKKRIILDMPCLEWINQSIVKIPLIVLPMTPAIAVDSCNLPDNFHADPADCLIAATVRVERLMLLTRDKNMLAYGGRKHMTVMKV